jgi:hypothetical protein
VGSIFIAESKAGEARARVEESFPRERISERVMRIQPPSERRVHSASRVGVGSFREREGG